MSAGQQVASRTSVPLLGGSFPTSGSAFSFAFGLGIDASGIAAGSSSLNRSRNAASVDAPIQSKRKTALVPLPASYSIGNLFSRCSATASASASISPRTVSGPKLTRTVPAAVRRSTPMALSTWLTRPLWQADPAEM